jgi:hypothetical protein
MLLKNSVGLEITFKFLSQKSVNYVIYMSCWLPSFFLKIPYIS